MGSNDKVSFSGKVLGVQPRIRLMRSFSERAHTYQGYNLFIDPDNNHSSAPLIIAIGKSAHLKNQFQQNNIISGAGVEVHDTRLEIATLYKVSRLKKKGMESDNSTKPPPCYNCPPDLKVYKERGHRRLNARTYSTKCSFCMWGCKMPVALIVDHWNPSDKKYRFETFCYGPGSCPLFNSGPARKLYGRNGMTAIEDDWVDAQDTAHRGPDD